MDASHQSRLAATEAKSFIQSLGVRTRRLRVENHERTVLGFVDEDSVGMQPPGELDRLRFTLVQYEDHPRASWGRPARSCAKSSNP